MVRENHTRDSNTFDIIADIDDQDRKIMKERRSEMFVESTSRETSIENLSKREK